jgi:RNA 2',3'-cyclic 3'-phosphodiesterase
MRVFIALDPDLAMRERLRDLIASLRGTVTGIRWTAPEAIHLTLKFLGNTSSEKLRELSPALNAAARACHTGRVEVSGLGLFPDRGAPRILWIDMPSPEGLVAVQRRMEEAAIGVGFPAEPRPFRPHLTLGRFGRGAPRPDLPRATLGLMPVEEVVLYKSELRPKGAVYMRLESFPLSKP